MSIVKKLAGQTATYGLSTILVKFINYVLTIYLTRVLTDAQYGVQSYYYAFIPFGLTVLTMGLETGTSGSSAKPKTPRAKTHSSTP